MSTLRANTLKPITSGNSLVLQGDSGGSGVSGPSIDSNGDVDFSQNTDAKVKLPSGGGIYESDGSTEILTESSGTVSLKNTSINANNVFPAGHIIQFEQSFTETGGTVIGNLSSVGSGSPATILTATINDVLASSKVFGFFYSGYMVLDSSQFIRNRIAGGSINTEYFNQSSGNARYSPTFFFYDDAPGTGTNSYVLTGFSNASGNAAYWTASGGYAYGWMLFEVAQ